LLLPRPVRRLLRTCRAHFGECRARLLLRDNTSGVLQRPATRERNSRHLRLPCRRSGGDAGRSFASGPERLRRSGDRHVLRPGRGSLDESRTDPRSSGAREISLRSARALRRTGSPLDLTPAARRFRVERCSRSSAADFSIAARRPFSQGVTPFPSLHDATALSAAVVANFSAPSLIQKPR
jgi:hypothetical protein